MVWERIEELKRQEEQIERDRAIRAAQEEANRIKMENEKATKAQQKEQERIREVQERRRLTKEVLEKSGVLSGMREIEIGLVGNVRKHALVKNLDRGYAILAWGNKFKVTDTGDDITYDRLWGIKYTGIMDYSYIEVKVNASSQSVTIRGEEVKKDQWSTNRAVVQDLLAQAYLHPQRVNRREEPPSKYSSSSSGSSSTECCNN